MAIYYDMPLYRPPSEGDLPGRGTRMAIARFALGVAVILCLGVNSPQVGAEANNANRPCPNVISMSEAIQIAREEASDLARDFDGLADPSAEWKDASWSVNFRESSGGGYWLTVYVRADGHVVDCIGGPCEPAPGAEIPWCNLTAMEFIGKDEAAKIAQDHIKRGNFAPVALNVSYVLWQGPHWSVSIAPNEMFIDSDFIVYVSPNGLQAEFFQVLSGPPVNSFVYREPEPN